jgi:hypothetical protein
MASALAAPLLWLLEGRAETVGVLLVVGVGVGLPSGMLFKIMPFLSWFHLQHRQLAARQFDLRIPHMHGFVPDRQARIQFGLHLAALGLLIAASALPDSGLARPAGLALAVSAAYLGFLLVRCYLLYRRLAHGLDSHLQTRARG